jgi:hypothetical protein
MWDEVKARRGSCEIASCLWKWLNSIPATVTHVILYCDCCSGQNRNVQIATMLLSAVKCLHIQTIDLKFLESGHTQMEVDAMHATIERVSKSVDIFIPRDWQLIAATARRDGKPYHVTCMEQCDVLDWKSVCKHVIVNKSNTDTPGVTVNWKEIKWLQVSKDSTVMKFKYELNDSEFLTVKYRGNARGRLSETTALKAMMKPLYSKLLSISKPKYNDLMDLCKTSVIPSDYHSYYMQLPHSAKVRDTLDESDVEDVARDDN